MLESIATIDKSEHLIEVANYNSPEQVVLSGTAEAIEVAESHLNESNLRAVRLSVGAAFHSSLMQVASENFSKELKNIKFEEGSVPVYSNTLADVFPKAAKDKSTLLARQLRESVQFEKMIRKMVEDGCRIFVEAGPSGVLGRLVGQILEDEPHVVLSFDTVNLRQTNKRSIFVNALHL